MTQQTRLPQGQKSMLELGPVVIFLVILYAGRYFGLAETEDRFLWATIVMLPLAVLSLAYIWFRERETPWLLLVSTVLLVGFGSLTIGTGGDPFWLKVKLTAVSLVYAAGLGITWLMGFPLLKKLFGASMQAEDSAWLRAALLMALGSLLSAGANELLWIWLSPEAWAFAGKVGLAVFNGIFTMVALFPIIQETARNAENS